MEEQKKKNVKINIKNCETCKQFKKGRLNWCKFHQNYISKAKAGEFYSVKLDKIINKCDEYESISSIKPLEHFYQKTVG